MNTVLENGPSNVEKWTNGLHSGIKRWKGVEQRRLGLGDGFYSNGKLFAEMNYTMREIRLKVRLGKTHQQRALQMNMAKMARNPTDAHAGWVEITIDDEARLQEAMNIARQGWMESQR